MEVIGAYKEITLEAGELSQLVGLKVVRIREVSNYLSGLKLLVEVSQPRDA